MASLSNGFYGFSSQNNLINNQNNIFYNKTNLSNQKRMVSPQELSKKKASQINLNSKNRNNQNYYAQNNINLILKQYGKFNNNIHQKKIRNNSFGNNIINKKHNNNFNMNNINNQIIYDDDDVDLNNEKNSFNSPGNYNIQNVKLFKNNKSSNPINNNINNFKVNPFKHKSKCS